MVPDVAILSRAQSRQVVFRAKRRPVTPEEMIPVGSAWLLPGLAGAELKEEEIE
jgi:hypothetical protein